ncbi:MAG: hypothetical protein DU429_06470 [Candidatus Tokpelaia sp.]|nr:MAG: hypothetical protein DU429_06470 [Candidatus Tokpelaia sp.]
MSSRNGMLSFNISFSSISNQKKRSNHEMAETGVVLSLPGAVPLKLLMLWQQIKGAANKDFKAVLFGRLGKILRFQACRLRGEIRQKTQAPFGIGR